MNRNKGIQWLYDELDNLVAGGVVDNATANRFHDYYGPVKVKSRSDILITIFSVVGASFIGLGIILVLASNWDQLGRPIRAIISITPLVISQLICAWVLLKNNESLAWREGASTFLMLSVAVSISLIGQTYNIPGNLGGFLLTWLLLTLPIVYLMSAIVPAIGYIIMITCWTGYAQSEGGQPAFFYLMAAGIAPFVWFNIRRDPESPRARLLLWSVALAPCIATGVVLEKAIPGIWLLVYTSYFALLYLLDAIWLQHDNTERRRPFLVVGRSGIIVLALMFTFSWPWRHIGWNHYRYNNYYSEWFGALDALLLLAFLIPATALLVRAIKQKRYDLIPMGITPAITIVAWAITAYTDDAFFAVVLFNIYVLCLAVTSIASGAKTSNLGTVNVGLALIFFLIMFRFFDVDMSFVMRGVVFILLGIGFLTTNLVLNRRFKEAA